MSDIKKLQTIKISNMQEGRQRLEEVTQLLHETAEEMQHLDEKSWNELIQKHYELKKAKRHIQHSMGRLMADRRSHAA